MTTHPSQPPAITGEQAEQLLRAQLAQAEAAFENAVWDLVRFYSVTGRQSVAFSHVERLLNATNDLGRKARYYLALGQLMEQVHDYEAALAHYAQGLALEPVDPPTCYFLHNNLGYCLNRFGRHAEAERYCQTAIQIDPQRHNAYKNLGLSLAGQGLCAPAARCFIAAIRVAANDPRALRHLEELLAKHPELTIEFPEVGDHLHACREAVRVAAQTHGGNQPKAPTSD